MTVTVTQEMVQVGPQILMRCMCGSHYSSAGRSRAAACGRISAGCSPRSSGRAADNYDMLANP